MNSDFWKQYADAPPVDCVKMKQDIQAQIYEETKGMTREERDEHRKRRVAAFRAGRTWENASLSAELMLREEPPEYVKDEGKRLKAEGAE